MSEQTETKFTPDEALRHTMETLRSTNPSPAVLQVIEEIEREIEERAGQPARSRKRSKPARTAPRKVPA